ncbi:MAG: hypothetical protein CL663_04990 [Bacteroidetes bacterium]|nr:hypothetical protein [Bacteroidota bacterium]
MYAVIDVETTGLSAKSEKITEIAIYIHDGEKIVDEFCTLIDPERKIPYQITRLTGINNQMVVNAPKFYEVAKQIVELTEDKIIVGHHVTFDYNFIRSEFKSLGYDFKRKTLCTVKLARKLIPGRKSYGLGKLCKELNIENTGRHRAFGDALATVKVFELLLNLDENAAEKSLKGYQSDLSKDIINGLPEKPGVYYFYNKKEELIYIGKSKSIRDRVLSHLNNNLTRKAIEMRDAIANVSFEETGSELAALLLESHEIKKHKPLYNRAQRRTAFNYGLYQFKDENGYDRLNVLKLVDGATPLTSYTSKAEANQHVFSMVEEYELCQKLCSLYESEGPCFHHQIHQCKGACIGEESPETYNKRLQSAIQNYQFKHQSFFVIDCGKTENEKTVIQIKNGKYLGFGYIDSSSSDMKTEQLEDCITSYDDNKDVQQIIRSHLRRNPVEAIISY